MANLTKKVCIILLSVLWTQSICYGSNYQQLDISGKLDRTCEFDVSYLQNVTSISLYGRCSFRSSTSLSLFRMIIVTKDGKEFLVSEKNNYSEQNDDVEIEGQANETFSLGLVSPKSLKIVLLNASVDIDSILIGVDNQQLSSVEIEKIKDKNISAEINNYSDVVSRKGLLWKPGKTSLSTLSYSQKKISCMEIAILCICMDMSIIWMVFFPLA